MPWQPRPKLSAATHDIHKRHTLTMAKKRYNLTNAESQKVAEMPFDSRNAVTVPAQITVNIEDASMLKEIKRAISMIRGVVSVDKSPAMKSYERARADVKAGRIIEFENVDALKAYFDAL